MKWLATVLFLSAGTLLSLNIEISRFGFLLFLTGHVLLSYYFVKGSDEERMLYLKKHFKHECNYRHSRKRNFRFSW